MHDKDEAAISGNENEITDLVLTISNKSVDQTERRTTVPIKNDGNKTVR